MDLNQEQREKINKEIPIHLSDEQIEEVCNKLRLAPQQNECLDKILENHKNRIREELQDIKIKPSRYEELKETIILQFYKSLIAPGESAGTNAAQNIGEPTTQQSQSRHDKIPLMLKFANKTEYYNGPIGDIIDKIMDKWSNVIFPSPGQGEYATPSQVQVFVNTVNPMTLKCEWKLVEQVSRHPCNGGMIKVTTKSGRSTTTTLAHSHLQRAENGLIIPIRGDKLKIGDSIPVCKQMNIHDEMIINTFSKDGTIYTLDANFGEELALCIAFPTEYFGTNLISLCYDGDNPEESYIPLFMLFSPIECIGSFLKTFFPIARSGNKIITLGPDFAQMLALLLSRVGLYGEFKYYFTLASGQRLPEYIINDDLSANLDNIIWDEIVKLEVLNDPNELVYDLGVSENHTFMLQSGIFTHNTLNYFHSTGISAKNVTLGFSRAKELFNATSTPSNAMCTIYFTKHNQTLEDLHTAMDKMPQAKVNDLLKRWLIISPTEYKTKKTWWHKAFEDLNNAKEPAENEWCLRLKFNIQKLYDHDITLEEIQETCSKKYNDIRCIYSPLNLGVIDVLVDCTEISIKGVRTEELPIDKDEQVINNDETRLFYMKNIVSVEIRNILACGISCISKLYPRKTKVDDIGLKPEIKNKIKFTEEWIVETDGNNLKEVLNMPFVDYTRTISNDMWEIYNIFGIEAVKTYLTMEFNNIISVGGTYINNRHIGLLVDKMTCTGDIRAIARFGVESSQYGPITRASFEEVMKHLVMAAIFSEIDNLNGISSNIALGTKIRAGTGFTKTREIPLKVTETKLITEDL